LLQKLLKRLGPGRILWINDPSYGMEQVESSCEFGNEPTGSMKFWETIEWPDI
jgi:hypothetical protein